MKNQTVSKAKVKAKVFLKPNSDENKAINAYLNGQTGKFGQFFALPNALVHRLLDCDYKTVSGEVKQSIIAMNLNGHKIGNSSTLPFVNSRVSFGERNNNRSVTTIQEKLSQFLTMIPFTVFNEAQLDIRKLNILEKQDAETITIRIENPKYKYNYNTNKGNGQPKHIDETRHYTGACLFEVEGICFLFDIDRVELKNKLFNAFLAEIPVTVKTVADAYRALKPAEVILAEIQGLEVKRQGEWFFIPVKGEHSPDMEERSRFGGRSDSSKAEPRRLELRAGNNRPNHAEMGVEAKGLVKGKISHSGREHKDLVLKTWHKAVPNTATRSFTIVGDVD